MSDWDDPGLSALYRRTPRSGPTARSDRQILESARRALQHRRWRAGYAAWALATSLLLGVGIGWQLLQPQDELAILEPAPPASDRVSEGRAEPAVDRDAEDMEKRRQDFSGQERATAPAATLKQTAPAAPEATRFETAPRSGLACRDQWPAADAAADDWLAAIARAEAAGRADLARCLHHRYRALFGDAGQ